jgi:hypothetical protein
VGVFLFFSALWAEMQSSWVMAILTSSLKLLAFTKFNRSLKFGVQASSKMISFACIIVRMVSYVLAQVVKDLCILQGGAGSLSQIQKFIELSLNESFGDMVRSKSSPKFIPSDDMTGRLHGVIMIPPDVGSAT